MIAITGATGQFGRLVIEQLLKTVPANQIVAIVRNPAKAEALSQQGIVVRQGDYTDQAALTTALKGVEKLLLISSSEVGQRATQHQNVINAAKAAGVTFIAYTSLLHADNSPLGLHVEHVATEKALATSGIPYALLRNIGILKTTWRARRLRWNTACLSVPQVKAKSPQPPVRITRRRRQKWFRKRATLARSMNWQATARGR